MPRPQITRVHLIVGGFPPGTAAGHDMNYARLRLLGILEQNPAIYTTVSNDYGDLTRWLPDARLLVTYVAGPYPDDEQNEHLRGWLQAGGRFTVPAAARPPGWESSAAKWSKAPTTIRWAVSF